MLLFQAFIIAWTSEFVPKLVYVITESEDSGPPLRGYMNDSLSVFDVGQFRDDQVPRDPDPQFSNVTTCMYKGWRHPPGHEDEYGYTTQFYLIFTARLAFVIIFEVRPSIGLNLIDEIFSIVFLAASRVHHALPHLLRHP